MKKISKKGFILIISIIILINIIGYFFNIKYISVFAAIAEVNKYEVRSQLLLEALDFVGVCSSEEAVDVWSKGLQKRNGALQMSVMSSKLRKAYIPKLDKYNNYWVTGISSPYINSYKIINTKNINEKTKVFEMSYESVTSQGPFKDYKATITVKQNNNFWEIVKIDMEKELYPYAGIVK